MTGRFIDHCLRILAVVALLAVMSSPIRPSKTSRTAPSTDYLPRKLLILNHGCHCESTISARPSLREADCRESDIEDELEADIEDELTIKSSPATVSCDVLPSPCPEHHSERVGFAFALTTRPLRC